MKLIIRSIKVIAPVIMASVLLVGCGDEQKDNIKSHIEAWAKGDKQGAIEHLSVTNKNALDSIERECARMKVGVNKRQFDWILRQELEPDLNKINEIKKEQESKGVKASDLTKEKKIELFNKIIDTANSEVAKVYLEGMKELIINEPSRKEIKKIEKELMNKVKNVFIQSEIKKNNYTEQCKNEIYKLEGFKKINLIDGYVEDTPDRKIIRTEIVYKEGNTKKYDSVIELIDGEWKITDTYVLLKLGTKMQMAILNELSKK